MGHLIWTTYQMPKGYWTMSRVILARNDLLTLFDLRAQNFRVNVEFSTCHRGQKIFSKKCPKVTFRLEKKILNYFLKQLLSDRWWSKKYQKLFFRAEGVLSENFFKISVAKMGIKRLHFDQKSPWTPSKNRNQNYVWMWSRIPIIFWLINDRLS